MMTRLTKNPLLQKVLYRLYQSRSKKIANNIRPIIGGRKNILDIGSGTGCIMEIVKKEHKVVPIDIKDISLKEDLKPLIFDGKIIPFANDEFDVAFLITVLHHTKNPDQLLREAKRVSDKILVIEDVFSSPFQFYRDCFMDSLINFEIINHPHSNRSDLEWKNTFEKLGLKLEKSAYTKSCFGFKHALYYLSK
jgi:SAM-dependent methyltransferase